MIDRRIFFHINWSLLLLTLILAGIGVMNLYSASALRIEEGVSHNPYYAKQALWTGIAFIGMLLCMSFDYHRLASHAWLLFLLSLALLLTVPFLGKSVYGSKRWIDLYFFHIQPSEPIKVAVMILGARVLSADQSLLDWKGLLRILPVGLIPAVIVVKQPDLGSGLTILFILGGMIFYHGIEKRVLKPLLLIFPALPPLAWYFLHDYQKERILTFLDPAKDPLGSGYHILQSRIAIGSGQIWGQGFLSGSQSQLRFLPERHTDFAFAVFGEEWGFLGAIVLLFFFCAFLYQLAQTARESKDTFGVILGCGIFCYFFWQVLINMSMVLGLMPVVGIPLPFISYGGSSTLVNFCLVGLSLNICMRRYMFQQD